MELQNKAGLTLVKLCFAADLEKMLNSFWFMILSCFPILTAEHDLAQRLSDLSNLSRCAFKVTHKCTLTYVHSFFSQP